MSEHDNPIFGRSTPTRQSQPYSGRKPQPNAKVVLIIQKLGLRYQPNSADALEDHRGKVALLICDVDGLIPSDILDKVCSAWIMKSPYFPKASDLIQAAKEEQDKGKTEDDERKRQKADEWNFDLHTRNINQMRWVAHMAGGLKLNAVAKPMPMPPPLSYIELQKIASLGAMGKAILALGVAAGDLTQRDVDDLLMGKAA